jgi:hypothetical protein
MNREIGRFLIESWNLFYWSLFCPSLLQQRMNERSAEKTAEGLKIDTSASDILDFATNYRFSIQYFFIWLILSLPLADLIFLSGRRWDLLLLSIACLIGYLLGAWFLPSGIGFCSPLLLALIYWQKAEFFEKTLRSISLDVIPEPKLFTGMCIGSISLSTTLFVVWIFLKKNYIYCARNTFWFGSGLSVLSGTWLASQNWLLTLSYTTLTSIFSFFISDLLNSEDGKGDIKFFALLVMGGSLPCILIGNVAGFSVGILMFTLIFIALGVATLSSTVAANVLDGIAGLTFILATILAFVVAVVMTGFLVGISGMALHWFLLAAALLAFGCAPMRKHLWLGMGIATVFTTLGWEKLGFDAFWAFPVSIIVYYRIFPDYLVTYLSSLIFTQSLTKRFSINPASLLKKFPPYTTELLWLPLPNHAQILADTFRQNTFSGLITLQKMQSISLPGFQLTIQKALPMIVANRFDSINTTLDLIVSATTHPILPYLIPAFYQSDKIDQSLAPPKSGNSEIDFFLPRLQQIAKDTASALEGGSSTLRERGLERLVGKLKILSEQLPGLGLKTQAIKRWQPAIKRWQHILEIEIAEQQKTSQGELLNPFQFGNPLRQDSATIFKGRQDFADQLVRLILDRNRPTLVLHGPRRAGKTSFLLNLPRLLPSDLIPIYLDMQQNSMTNSEGDFCYGLVRAIQRDTRSQGLQIPSLPSRQDFATQPYPTLEDWLDSALSQLGERRLLLNLDEFEKIGSAIKEQRISDRLFDQLRSMIQHDDRLGFLFSGVQTLEELGPRWSNYFISVVPMEMHYLEPAEAEDLLLNPDPEFTLRYDPGIVDDILTLTRCQPYLLQLIGFALVTEANRQQTQTATTELLQSAIQSAFTNGEPYFTNIWTEFTGTTPNEVAAGQNLLLALARGNSQFPIICNAATTAANRRLLRYHVIERINENIDRNQADATWETAHCHIEIPLFEQWVKERAIKI